ncbi:MAG: hypothetical protein V7647_3464 [Acidobacteriota bacterium]
MQARASGAGALFWTAGAGPHTICAMPTAGYSGTPLPKKLEIRENTRVATVGAPADFAATLGALPEGAALRRGVRAPRDLTIWFVTSRRQLAGDMPKLIPARGGGSRGVAWPKN